MIDNHDTSAPMDDEQWAGEINRCTAVVIQLCQAVLDETFEFVRVVDTRGKHATGIKVGDRVLLLVVPTAAQVPSRPAGTVLQ